MSWKRNWRAHKLLTCAARGAVLGEPFALILASARIEHRTIGYAMFHPACARADEHGVKVLWCDSDGGESIIGEIAEGGGRDMRVGEGTRAKIVGLD